MKPVTIYVSEVNYTAYQDEARRHEKTTAELIREAMTYYLDEKLRKLRTLDSWQPVSLGGLVSDYADNVNRAKMIDDRY